MQNVAPAFMRLTFLTLLLTTLVSCSLFSRGKQQPTVSDAALQAEVRKALNLDPALKGTQINVHSANGVVELSGSVNAPAVKARAGLVAASTPGVVQVHNDLLTPPPGGS